MLYLKEANFEDIEKEYEYITNLPENENGYLNANYGVSREEFESRVLPGFINASKGIGLPPGRVPGTQYFLWNDDVIVGLFRFRHMLNDVLREGAGHIGFGIRKEYRGKGYATKGLALLLEIAKKEVLEDEIYMSVDKTNPASLKVMLNNGAYIHHENEEEYFTRIKL